jgi:hypothetical protein
MYFLKCNECGHLNELKTEYLTFCSKCNKKLDNNFSNWKKNNPDGTFEDYKNLICITVQDLQQLNLSEKKKNPKGLKYWIGFAVALTIFYVIGQFGGEKLVSLFRKPSYDKAMMEFSSEFNKTCPIMIDNVTRLDNVVVLPNNVLQYNYSILSLYKDSVNIEEMKTFLEPNILSNAKTNPQMKMIRDNNTTLNYNYKDKEGVFLLLITIKPEQYKEQE